MRSGVNTESSKQHSLVLHELSIKQDVVQLRLEADWLDYLKQVISVNMFLSSCTF